MFALSYMHILDNGDAAVQPTMLKKITVALT